MNKKGFSNMYNYLDDLLYSSLPSQIYDSFKVLYTLFQQLDLDVNPYYVLLLPSVAKV